MAQVREWNTEKAKWGSPTFTSDFFLKAAKHHKTGKQSGHEKAYSLLSLEKQSVRSVLEIGIGTNNPTIPSSMGKSGVPGASLRLFRELFPKAWIFGADFDKKILFTEDRISCFFVDSTNEKSVIELLASIEKQSGIRSFDLIVDDGLHTPEANLRNFRILKEHVADGGFYVIEDIDYAWSSLFNILGRAIENFDSQLIFGSEAGSPEKNQSFLVLRKRLV